MTLGRLQVLPPRRTILRVVVARITKTDEVVPDY
jgi:hypothetical protein